MEPVLGASVTYNLLESLVHELRWVKTPAEVEVMRASAEITTEAFSISWHPPEAVPEAFNLAPENFDYIVTITGGSNFLMQTELFVGEELDKDFRTSELELKPELDLKPGTWYTVTVTAHCNNPSIFDGL